MTSGAGAVGRTAWRAGGSWAAVRAVLLAVVAGLVTGPLWQWLMQD